MNLSTSDFSTATSIDVTAFRQSGANPCAPALIDASHPERKRAEAFIAQRFLVDCIEQTVDALRYAGSGCRVRLQYRREGGERVLTVDDPGPGLDAEQRDKAPGRFYRAGIPTAATPALDCPSSKSSPTATPPGSN